MASTGYREPLINSQIDSTAITAASATSCIPAAARKLLPGNYFDVIGKTIELNLWGRISTVVTTPGTLRFDVRIGAVIVFDSLAIALVTANAYTNVGFHLRIVLTARAVGGGTTANLMGQGFITAPNILGGANVAMPIGGVCGMLPWNSAPAVGTGFDSTASNYLDVFFTQTVATGSQTTHLYTAEGLN